jgi:hypothetical protein
LEHGARVEPTVVSKWVLVLPGFAPAGEVLLFRQKDPKPWWPWRGPSGALRRAADFGGAQTRYAQTMRAFLRIRLYDLASPQGHRLLVKEEATESLVLLKDSIDFMFCAAGTKIGTIRYQEGVGSFLGYQSPFPREAGMGAATAGSAQMVST